MDRWLALQAEIDQAEADYVKADLDWWATCYRSERLGHRVERLMGRYLELGRSLGALNRKEGSGVMR